MIRSSKHLLLESNGGKIVLLKEIIAEYRRVGQLVIDDIWLNGYKEFEPLKDKLVLPKYLDYNDFKIETKLSARMLSSLVTQVSGVLRGVVEYRKKLLWILTQDPENPEALEKKLEDDAQIGKPYFGSAKMELSSKCSDIVKCKNFTWYVRLKCTGFGSANFPIRTHKHCENLKKKGGKLKNSFLFSENSVELRWEIPVTKSCGTKIVGVDQGVNSIISLSDDSEVGNCDSHGHTLKSIMTTLSRRKKNSKGFKRAQAHRKNLINHIINQVDWSQYSEVRLEKVKNLRKGKRTSKILKHFTYPLIRDKIMSSCEEQKVSVIEQESPYRSQRCSSCGIVRKSNRKKKVYSCSNCNFVCDADKNAALNHAIDLPKLDYGVRDGFFWLPASSSCLGESESPIRPLEKDTFL